MKRTPRQIVAGWIGAVLCIAVAVIMWVVVVYVFVAAATWPD